MKFRKPPKDIDEQIALLRSRGLTIPNEAEAAHDLRHLNYYRLSGYWVPFEISRNPHRFRPGVTFDDVINLYTFDRKLRLLVLDAIEHIEVSLRTQWAYHFAHQAGSHAYLDRHYAASTKQHDAQLKQMAIAVERSQELFITHYRQTYTEPDMPPIWAACEVLSLGQLSHWYKMLRPIRLRARIAATYNHNQKVLASVLHHLTYLRNLCAHHNRIWNRELTFTVMLPKTKPPDLARSVERQNTRRIYNSLCVILDLMNTIVPGHDWRTRLLDLLTWHGITAADMGFPVGWNDLPLWQEVFDKPR